ncbi:phosphoserine phosphatase SerB [Marinomonas ostreistagni]|uniref:phosphoserine phosphatase SerB n=1 Tax=Marinomonas ostreistagni TaxID=359209 RepID=UPI0019528750|nr:phosphoserine phosphatase SerB [Marinomonas ostreistagni]MBM6551343.1 phosphoserine phosphatase SerB [Marinomonas ostreistagni]
MSASITLIGDQLANSERKLYTWFAQHQLEAQKKLLTHPQADVSVQRYDISTPLADGKHSQYRQELLALANETGVDHVLQVQSPSTSQTGLAVFDMDSTLIKAEVIDELAVEMGIGAQVAAVTASAMRGEIEFTESFVQRLALLEGLSSEVMDNVYQRIVHMDGIAILMKALHKLGWKTAILSGGFTYFADRLQQEYGMTHVHANVLEIEAGRLTGKHIGPIVDAKRKQQLLAQLTEQYQLPVSQTIACGDGANDLLMLNAAGLGVALHAKPLVREQAPCPVNNLGLDAVLYLLGLSSDDIQALVS